VFRPVGAVEPPPPREVLLELNVVVLTSPSCSFCGRETVGDLITRAKSPWRPCRRSPHRSSRHRHEQAPWTLQSALLTPLMSSMRPHGALGPTNFALEPSERELGCSPPARAWPGKKKKQGKRSREATRCLRCTWCTRTREGKGERWTGSTVDRVQDPWTARTRPP
jgi:hypothetical protein